ncbi:MAG: GspJ family T2SS minor pseudopilin variant XcpW [Gammaproteobacteria bacterium]
MAGGGQRGFTLLELLVAMAVFAILAVMAYAGLNGVLENRRALEAQSDRLRQLQTAFLLIGRDLTQGSARWVRDELGGNLEPLKGGEGFVPLLELTHTGQRNPAGARRSHLERVAYQVQGEELIRLRWPVIDRAQDTVPKRRTLLTGVRAVSLRFYDSGNRWQGSWPPAEQTLEESGLPRAVEITLDLEDWGRISRLFALPG